MRNLRLERLDPEISLPTENPLILQATLDTFMVMGAIRHIGTGIKFYLPDDISCRFVSMVDGLTILDTKVNQNGELQLIVFCTGMGAEVRRLQPLAKMVFSQETIIPCRCSEFKGSTRIITGQAAPAIESFAPLMDVLDPEEELPLDGPDSAIDVFAEIVKENEAKNAH